MKKILLTIVALTLGIVASSAQIEQQIENIKDELKVFRTEIAQLANSIPDAQSSIERENIVNDIETKLDDIEKFINRKMNRFSLSSAISRQVKQDGFSMLTTPTKASIKFDDFAFSSSPVHYDYYDGDIEIRTTPTRQSVYTPDFTFESSPTRSSFRTYRNSNDDTLKVREGNHAKVSVVITGDYDDDSTTVVTYKDGQSFEYKTQNDKHKNNHTEEFAFVGVNNFINADGKIDQLGGFMELRGGRSIEVGFGTMFNRWDLANFLALELGIEYKINHYSFDQTFNLTKYDGKVYGDYNDLPVKNFKRHNLRLQYLTVPLVTEWTIGRGDKPFIIHAGIEGSVRIGCREKQVYKVNGDRKVNRSRSDFETNLFRYGVQLGLGFHNYEIYCNYSPMQLFKDGHGPELYPISIGFRFYSL